MPIVVNIFNAVGSQGVKYPMLLQPGNVPGPVNLQDLLCIIIMDCLKHLETHLAEVQLGCQYYAIRLVSFSTALCRYFKIQGALCS